MSSYPMICFCLIWRCPWICRDKSSKLGYPRTALRGMWDSVSAAQLVQTICRLKWRPSCLSKSGQKSGQKFWCTADTETKTWLHLSPLQFVHPLQILKMPKGCCKGALAQLPQRWFGAMMFNCLMVLHRLICLVSRQLSELCGSLCFKQVLSLWLDWPGSQIFCKSCLSFLAQVCRNKLSRCPQCIQTYGETVKTVMAHRFPSIQAATMPTRLE